MTREEILKLEPGPELDKLVAEKVMRWKRTAEGAPPGCAYWKDGDGFICATEDPGGNLDWNPSRDIAAVWGVVEKLLRSGLAVKISRLADEVPWIVDVWNNRTGAPVSAASDFELPFVICLAALLAIEADGEAS